MSPPTVNALKSILPTAALAFYLLVEIVLRIPAAGPPGQWGWGARNHNKRSPAH
ncbi:MAG TPA: hypothetical protein VMR98_02455 [Candidatus Polarisedimenticolaceae bacterium]|nr:hypothetical protein [Candidatus Polarisedimenticolaceae bacterium]